LLIKTYNPFFIILFYTLIIDFQKLTKLTEGQPLDKSAATPLYSKDYKEIFLIFFEIF
jgi:hypothetical protein